MILWLFSAGFPKGGHQRGSRKFLIRKNSFLQRVVLIESPQLCKIVHFSRFFCCFSCVQMSRSLLPAVCDRPSFLLQLCTTVRNIVIAV